MIIQDTRAVYHYNPVDIEPRGDFEFPPGDYEPGMDDFEFPPVDYEPGMDDFEFPEGDYEPGIKHAANYFPCRSYVTVMRVPEFVLNVSMIA